MNEYVLDELITVKLLVTIKWKYSSKWATE